MRENPVFCVLVGLAIFVFSLSFSMVVEKMAEAHMIRAKAEAARVSNICGCMELEDE